MIELTSREQATVILFALFVGTFLFVPKLRRQVVPSFVDLLKIFFNWKIQIPLLIYFAYASAIVYLAWRLRTWEIEQFKDTAIVVFFVGLPLVFGANRIKDGRKLVTDVVRDAAGVSALLAFYVGTVSLPLWGELLLQPVVILVSMLAAVARYNPEQRSVARFMNWILGIIGIGLLIYTTKMIVSDWNSSDWSDAARSLALSIWLPITLIPFVYFFAYFMHVELILTMLPFFNDGKKPRLRARLAVIWGLHFSTRLASQFVGNWRSQVACADGLRGGLHVMRNFHQAVKKHDEDIDAYAVRLKQMAGVAGVDETGLQLDRREFYETKKELTNLYFMEMGRYRNRGGRYRPELVDLLGDMTKKGLPIDHGIHLLVRKDGQTWRAWRRTPSGWFFGVGGTSTLEHQWQYDGPTPPSIFPSGKSPGWTNATIEAPPQEWEKNDEPPTRA